MSDRPLVLVDADVLGRHRTGDETYVAQLLRELPGAAPDLRFAAVTRDLAQQASRLQTGYLYHYAFAMMIGLVALVTWYLFPR